MKCTVACLQLHTDIFCIGCYVKFWQFWGYKSYTRTVQPVATCRQSPYVHKPVIVKLLLLIYTSNSGLLSVQRRRPASHAHFRHWHIPELICEINSSIDIGTPFGCAPDSYLGMLSVLSTLSSSASEVFDILALYKSDYYYYYYYYYFIIMYCYYYANVDGCRMQLARQRQSRLLETVAAHVVMASVWAGYVCTTRRGSKVD